MQLLNQRILKDGMELGTEIIKADSFLNHQLDIGLFMALGHFCRDRKQPEGIPAGCMADRITGCVTRVFCALSQGRAPAPQGNWKG